jgi:PBSX family phage terminase large subunit
VRIKAILLAYKFPGIKLMIVRRTYNELSENHIIPLCQTLHVYDSDPHKRLAIYNDSKKHIIFPNGSRILFRYCENDKDAERFQGTEVDVLFVDEATHQSESRIRKLNACVRGVNSFPKRTYYTCNPGGEGHAWVKRLFIDKRYKDLENPEDYTFIQSLVTDNKALMQADPEYIKQLESLPPKLREAWLNGRWDIFEGQVFEEFVDNPDHYKDRLHTHVINPFKIPPTWDILRGFDWGYSKPFSVGWYAVDNDNRLYRIRELYGCTKTANEGVKWTTDQVAEAIAQIEQTDINLKDRQIRGIADPAIFERSTGTSIADDMERHGVYFDPGDHKRIPGKMQCHYRLHFDDDGIPMFYVFNNCPQFIRCIPALIYSETKVEDINTDMEDHNYDEWRYICMDNPMNPEDIIDVEKIIGTDGINDPLGMIADANRIKYDNYNFYRT